MAPRTPVPAQARLALVSTLVLALLAHLPLLPSGLLADDVAVLLRAAGESVPAPPGREPDDAPPLVAPSFRWSGSLAALSQDVQRAPGAARELGGGGLGGAALRLRLENLLLLGLCALGLGLGTRRLFLPWTGSDHARAAGWGAGALLAVHPLSVSCVAGAAARGELLGVGLAAWTLALFLRGRQDRVASLGLACVVTAALAGMASDVALGLPFLLAGAELFSAHRYRPLRVRLRTCATTLVVFGLAASFETLLALGRVGSAGLPDFVRALGGAPGGRPAAELLGGAIEKLGLFVLPANPFVTEIAGFALAGAVFLLAMHPGLSAARSAPRLWGWVLAAWSVALAGSELFHLHREVDHARLSEARWLFSSVAVVCVGLGVATTALSGMRRVLYPALVALGYAVLAHANALSWPAAARAVGELRADLVEARERHGADPAFLVLDPPERMRGVALFGAEGEGLPALLHPALDPEPVAPGAAAELSLPGPTPRVLGLGRTAFLVLVDQPEAAALLERGAVVLFEERQLEPTEEPSRGLPSLAEEPPGRRSVRLSAPEPSGRPLSWRGSLRSPNLDLEALSIGALEVSARAELGAARGQRVSWRGRERSLGDGALSGFWYEEEGRSRAVFAVGDALSWRLADRIKRVWFEGGLSDVEQVSAVAGLPPLGLEPRPDGEGAWRFPRSPLPLARRAQERGAGYAVVLFDLASLEARELSVLEADAGELRAAGAAELVRRWLTRDGGPVVWRIELRAPEGTVARSQGRLVAERAPEVSAAGDPRRGG